MIDKADFCIFYYNENYTPIKKSNNLFFADKQTNSGTKIAYNYAIKNKKEIINILNNL